MHGAVGVSRLNSRAASFMHTLMHAQARKFLESRRTNTDTEFHLRPRLPFESREFQRAVAFRSARASFVPYARSPRSRVLLLRQKFQIFPRRWHTYYRDSRSEFEAVLAAAGQRGCFTCTRHLSISRTSSSNSLHAEGFQTISPNEDAFLCLSTDAGSYLAHSFHHFRVFLSWILKYWHAWIFNTDVRKRSIWRVCKFFNDASACHNENLTSERVSKTFNAVPSGSQFNSTLRLTRDWKYFNVRAFQWNANFLITRHATFALRDLCCYIN